MNTFRSEYLNNADFANNPENVEFYLGDEWRDKIANCSNVIKELGCSSIVFNDAGEYEFFADDSYEETFDPDYSVSGCDLLVYRDGKFKARFLLKHCGNEGWTDTFTFDDGIAD